MVNMSTVSSKFSINQHPTRVNFDSVKCWLMFILMRHQKVWAKLSFKALFYCVSSRGLSVPIALFMPWDRKEISKAKEMSHLFKSFGIFLLISLYGLLKPASAIQFIAWATQVSVRRHKQAQTTTSARQITNLYKSCEEVCEKDPRNCEKQVNVRIPSSFGSRSEQWAESQESDPKIKECQPNEAGVACVGRGVCGSPGTASCRAVCFGGSELFPASMFEFNSIWFLVYFGAVELSFGQRQARLRTG